MSVWYPLILLFLRYLCCGLFFDSATAQTLFAHKNIYGAIIQTDPRLAPILGRDFHKVPQGVNGSQHDNALLRIENAKILMKSLPFTVEVWYSIYSESCPGRPTKGNDRGVSLSHHQIWHDFVHQGKGAEANDNDILVVFEDDAVIAVNDINKSLTSELGHMDVDLLFLGWCYGRRHMPMCTHAYALTRSGTKKILQEWDMCNTGSIDGQWHNLARKNLFTWRKANPDSYAELRPGFEDNPNYFTRGIFIQKNGLVSFNHHGFQNNAG